MIFSYGNNNHILKVQLLIICGFYGFYYIDGYDDNAVDMQYEEGEGSDTDGKAKP